MVPLPNPKGRRAGDQDLVSVLPAVAGRGDRRKANASARSGERRGHTKAELAAALEALRAYHEDLLSSLQDGVIILDRDSRIVSVNQAAEELTGFSRSQIAGRPIGDVFAPPAPLSALAAKTVARGRSHTDFDVHVVRADGSPLTLSTVASLMSDPTGEHRGVVLVLRDLSRVRRRRMKGQRQKSFRKFGVWSARRLIH